MKPYGRKTKKKVFKILDTEPRTLALKHLEEIPDEQLVGHLFSHFYHMDERIKFRSVTAMGELALRISGTRMEKARIILRRLMWNLNDESGGIGWGSPEAMGEILSKSPELAMEFKSILFSYLDHRGNHIEHEMLQRGVLWGIGTYLEIAPDDSDPNHPATNPGAFKFKRPCQAGLCRPCPDQCQCPGMQGGAGPYCLGYGMHRYLYGMEIY